ncbi:major facilitator superfamily domain-containing protein [Boletus edulis BED1]|uniref:Major facilitator superfamily domain-containing protein n=1 Tax=Boletus edulis BED1 TaxID=1328754 RepID=A0AAD4BWI9_BOLED|nr:major facilitator superfamily domain-containing protein [Boletus edulis BED1]
MMTPTSSTPENVSKPDIEHALVEDDPRLWSNTRKNIVLSIISGASMIAGLCANIQNPANSQIEQELHATASQISLSISLFILIQGNFPLVWSAVSEIKGRKFVYLISIMLFTVGSAIVAISKTIGLVIGMRVIQAAGSSTVISIGAATLADIYEPHQRGTKMGIYYSAPLLGPAIGPILGGGLTQGLSWRAIFWFLAIWGSVILSAFLFLFKDTFRKERSMMYQNVLKRRTQERNLAQEKNVTRGRPVIGEKISEDGTSGAQMPRGDAEAQHAIVPAVAAKEVKLSITDVNPFPPYLRVISRRNNLAILIPSGLLFAFSFSITYTCARTLSLYYDYNALTTGLVLLAYGIGSMIGSILGGRWSDRTLTKSKAANGGVSYAEMRLESTKLAMWFFPPSVIGYAWVCQQHVHVSAICVMLFLSGFFSIWIYASTLAYIVDANVGQSSSAVATNSSFRGMSAFIAVEIAVPLQDAIGDGGLYTLWAGLMVLAELMILLVLYKGKQWREASIEAEKRE